MQKQWSTQTIMRIIINSQISHLFKTPFCQLIIFHFLPFPIPQPQQIFQIIHQSIICTKPFLLIILIIFPIMSRQQNFQFNKTQMNMYSTLTPITTNYKNQDSTSFTRNTRNRYSINNQRNNPEQVRLASSISKEYRSQIKTPAPLPEIKRQKCIILQQWLNDALEGENVNNSKKQSLQTLKSYELDKANLKNQNLTLQQINKLYNGLFVYTSGLKNAFQQMFKMASVQQRQDNKFEKTYWKVFIKLLENSAPVKTCFQITEENYIREISQLKAKIGDIKISYEKQLTNEQNLIKKLRRQIEDEKNKFKQFQNDYKIMKATLDLTEQTFNEEVALRLKFQQKINQVYSSYDELQDKFQRMRTDLTYKNEHLVETMDIKTELTAQLTQERIKNEDLMQKLSRTEVNLKDRQHLLVIKNQQILDIRMQNCSVEQMKMKQQNALEQLLTTIKILKKNQLDHDLRIEEFKKQIMDYEETISKLKQNLRDTRQKNDDIYLKYHEATLKNVPVEQSNLAQSIQITQLKKKLACNNLLLQSLQNQNIQNKNKNDQISKQLQICNQDIAYKINQIAKYQQNLAEMKAIKDKYERINSKLTIEVQSHRGEYHKKIKELADTKAKIFDMKYEHQRLVQLFNQLQSSNYHLKMDLDAKNKQLEDEQIVGKIRGSDASAILKTKDMEIAAQKQEIKKWKDQYNRKDVEKIKKLEEITYLRKYNAIIEQQLKDKKNKAEELYYQNQVKVKQIQNLKDTIAGNQYTISKKKNQVDADVTNLKLSVANLKDKIQERQEYVHPMVAQDLRAVIMRMKIHIEDIKKKNQHVVDTYDEMVEEVETKRREEKKHVEEIQKIKRNNQILVKENSKIKQETKAEKKELVKKIQEKNQDIFTLKGQFKNKEEDLKKQLSSKTQIIKEINKKYDTANNQLKILQSKQKIFLQKTDEGQQTDEIKLAPATSLRQTHSINDGNLATTFHIQPEPSLKKSIRVSHRQAEKNNEKEKEEKSSQKYMQKSSQRYADVPLKLMIKKQSLALDQNEMIRQQERQETHPHYQQERRYRQDREQKKVDGKQFKKALRLTYMRR